MAIANVNSPRGFSLFRKGGKTEPNIVERRYIAANNTVIAKGDCYEVQADGTVKRAAEGDTAHGIVVGIRFQQISSRNVTESLDYIPAATVEAFVLGIEDKSAIFEVQSDSAAETNFDGTQAGIVDAEPDTTLAQSRQSVTVGAGTAQFNLVSLSPRTAENSEGAYAKVLVTLMHAFGSASA